MSLQMASASRPGSKATLLLMHGLGSHEHDLMELNSLIHAPLDVVSLRAPHPYGPGFAWFDLDFSVQPPKANLEQAASSLTDVLRLAEELAAEKPVIVGGFSQGAIMSLAAIGTSSELFRGGVLLSGAPVREDLIGPMDGFPVFISHGDFDDVLPAAGADAVYELLKLRGANVSSFRYAMGHNISEEVMEDLDEWFSQVLAA